MNDSREFFDGSIQAQRMRLLDALRCCPITSFEARLNLEVMMPSRRIKELRDRGCLVDKHFVWRPTDKGKERRVALYVLIAEMR